MDRLAALEIFARVVDTGSFSAVAPGINESDSQPCRRLLSSLRSGWELAC
jgi:hypothetical protein